MDVQRSKVKSITAKKTNFTFKGSTALESKTLKFPTTVIIFSKCLVDEPAGH